MALRFSTILIFLWCYSCLHLFAKDGTKEDSYVEKRGYEYNSYVWVDFAKGVFEPYSIPFDVPFVLRGKVPKEVRKVIIEYKVKQETKWKELPPWERDIYNMSAEGHKDTFYFIIPPLKAIKEYEFRFSVVRSPDSSEMLALNAGIRTMFKEVLRDGLYREATTLTISNDLQNIDPLYIRPLINRISTFIYEYYATAKYVTPKVDEEIKPVVENNILLFIKENFIVPMTDRINQEENLTEKINAAKRYWTNNSNMAVLFRKISEQQKTLKTSEPRIKFIRDVLLDEVMRPVMIESRSGPAAPFVTEKKLSSVAVKEYRSALDKSLVELSDIIVLLDEIKSDKKKFKTMKMTDIEFEKAYLDIKNFRWLLIFISSEIEDYALATKRLEDAFDNASFNFRANFYIPIGINGATTAEFVTRGEWYITADLGLAYYASTLTPSFKPYLGVNFNIFPINRQANYSIVNAIAKNKFGYILKGASIVVGLTVVEFGAESRYSDLFSKTSLLTGVGVRLTDFVRISGGALWAYKKQKNTLISDSKLVPNFYMALSLDWDVRRWLRNFGSTITGWIN